MKSINQSNILTDDQFLLRPVGSSAIQPPSFPGLGQNNYRSGGVSYTTIATKAAVINQLEASLVETPGYLVPALKNLPHLAVQTIEDGTRLHQRFTTAELPHRVGSGVFTLKHSGSAEWDFPLRLREKMDEVGAHAALAYYDPLSALFGCFLSHYPNIPSVKSKFTGAVVTGGCVASNTQQVVSSAVTLDPLGASKSEVGFLDGDKVKASAVGVGNLIHLQHDIHFDEVSLHLFLNQQRLRFYPKAIQDLLVNIYRYAALKSLYQGLDFRNRCLLKPLNKVSYNEESLAKSIQASITKCRRLGLLSREVLVRDLPISYLQ